MATRYSKEEKGKTQAVEEHVPHIKRIKAPYVDNSALIKENALTLIGRVTNPQEQRIWAVLPALPRKWHMQGRVTGSDLGNGCFQFRFKREEDLQRVLDNRPYQFAYWMVIIQRWEPIISASFPSQIPFWICIKGLPLHFWLEDMICNIGKDLGTILDHELTKTTARVKVLVDGLKPLTKEAIIEYDSREESIIYLEYEKLENHCSPCNSLSHLKKDCTMALRAEHEGEFKQKENMTAQRVGTYSEEDGSYRNSKHLAQVPHCSEEGSLPDGGGKVMNRVEQHKSAFHERVDRHGNIFGARAATKQTRVPPPTRTLEKSRGESYNWRSKASERAPEPQGYSSPPYTMRRDIVRETNFPRKNSFPQKGLSEWRMKPATLTCSERAHVGVPGATSSQGPLLEVTQEQTRQETPKGQTEEQITEDLNEATRLYLSCPDPTEAAARRHRVLAGDIRNQTEETATGLMRLRGSSDGHTIETSQNYRNGVGLSKDQVLQELQEVTKQYLSCADPVEAAARRQRVLAGDTEGLMEKTGESILAASAEQRRPLSPWERGVRSESPPGIDFDLAMQPSDVEVTPSPPSGNTKH